MFSGIVAQTCEVQSVEPRAIGTRLVIDLKDLSSGLDRGNSVAVNGVCLTVVAVEESDVSFDVVHATLRLTNLSSLNSGDFVNIERSLVLGNEIGGHLLAGHVAGTTVVESIQDQRLEFKIPDQWRKYFHTKGYIALDGVSLTLASFDYANGSGSVNLIPETLRRTTLKTVRSHSVLNFEVDPTTLAIVDTVERFMAARQDTSQQNRE